MEKDVFDTNNLRNSRPFDIPGSLTAEAVEKIATGLNGLLADVFTLYMKTKNFHWHISGRNFRDYHLLLDEQGDQLLAMIDPIAERVRKIGATTLRSISHIEKLQRINDSDDTDLTPEEMLKQLLEDNGHLVQILRDVHDLASELGDVATTSVLENWVDEGERRIWFLYETQH